ncbi:Clavaminate synthase-like protein [Periconia macrospinosa]|uniref:Clavaminate synthase-like protein n=1 Tax=Periconia macrospinosa TaxID=97972 RepID=A0A2V1EDU9_9PLEO|nr:Clavaminate synthase-like protein [Periconia macrospinosa]
MLFPRTGSPSRLKYILPSFIPRCRNIATTSNFREVVSIRGSTQDSISTEEPVVLKKWFNDIPAIKKWFCPVAADSSHHELDLGYLNQYGNTMVPLELTCLEGTRPVSFQRSEAPLSFLLMHMGTSDQSSLLYLAQCPLGDLPSGLQGDLPAPDLINRIGRGDIYSSSLWMGRAPTNTPLHRDPNPNLFVQLVGRKVVRLMEPDDGRQLYNQSRVGAGHANMRGEEMMVGKEMEQLDQAVWGEGAERLGAVRGVEAVLESGDALLIPLGWWHAVRGVGQGANASVNWWFR